MGQLRLFGRYRFLQAYVGWTEADVRRVHSVGPLLQSYLPSLVDDFYAEIQRHPEVGSVIVGGDEQIARLKRSLRLWVDDLLAGTYDEEYVASRWRVGKRHVDIGLDQIFTNAALSRLRSGMLRAICSAWEGDADEMHEACLSLTKLIDLDMAIIEDAYQAERSLQLQRTERLATMGQVAGGVAHELRNPLNVVKTSVYFLLNARNLTPEKTAEHLRRIERQVEMADGVITTLTSFAKMPSPNIRAVSVEQCLREALELHAFDPDVEVALDCPPGIPPVHADIDQLRIVFGNLIRNARDAMADGGRLAIEARRGDDEVVVAVSDTGVGISPEILARISEPLYSTKVRGLGLGLAIVRSILDKIKGQLAIESVPGQGSTFSVRLKISAESAGASL